MSPSSRRAWIEMSWLTCPSWTAPVALLAEGVDRNHAGPPLRWPIRASPSSRRAWIEISSSCTTSSRKRSPSSRRAWIEIRTGLFAAGLLGSPSSRRAWIEILQKGVPDETPHVALLAEGVDRNSHNSVPMETCGKSPSSRRAWIEISMRLPW